MIAIAPAVSDINANAAVLRIGKVALNVLKSHRATSMSLWISGTGVLALVMVEGMARNVQPDAISQVDLLDAFEGDFHTPRQHLLTPQQLGDDFVGAPMRVEADKGGVYVFVSWSAKALKEFGIRNPIGL